MSTTFSFMTNISKRRIATATLIGIASALFGAMTVSAAHAASPAQVDVCSGARPAGLWFPVQVERQFAAQCDGGSTKHAAPSHNACTAAIMDRGWVPPQVERQFAEWCK